MDSSNIVLGLSNIFCAILFIAISIPLVLGKIPMNSFYGVRLKKSYDSEENWYKINKYGGKQLIIWSIPLFIIGIITLLSSPIDSNLLKIIIVCFPLIVLIPAYTSYRYSRKI